MSWLKKIFGPSESKTHNHEEGREDHSDSEVVPPRTKVSKISLERIISLKPGMRADELADYQAHFNAAGKPSHLPSPNVISASNELPEYLSLSPDGSIIVTRRHYDGRLFVLDANMAEVVSNFKPEGVGWFQITPFGNEVVMVGPKRRSLVVYELASGQKILQTPDFPGDITSRFRISSDGSLIAVVCNEGPSNSLHIWSLREGSQVAEKELQRYAGRCFMAFSRDCSTLAVASGKVGVVWSTGDWQQIYTWSGPEKAGYKYDVQALDFTPEGLLVVGDNLGYLSRINLREQSLHYLSKQEDAPTFTVSVAPSGSLTAVGRGDSSLELWDVLQAQRLDCVPAHTSATGATKWVECIDWFPDGRRLATWGGYELKIWSISV